MKQYSFLKEGAGLTQSYKELSDINPLIAKALGNNVYKQHCFCKQRIEIICGDSKNGDLYLHNVHIYGTSNKKDQLMNLFSNLKDTLSKIGEDPTPVTYSWTDIDTGKTECFGSDGKGGFTKLNVAE